MKRSKSSLSNAANTASNGTVSSQAAPHSKNAAQRNNRSDSPYQGRTVQKDNPTQLVIKQAVDFLMQQVEAGKSDTLTAYLAAMARFHNYSFGNILTIARQRPTATRVAGYGTWKELGRFVKRGEKGIEILAPKIGFRRRNAEVERESGADADCNTTPQRVLIGFRIVRVFDVSQTEGMDLPEFEHNITGETPAGKAVPIIDSANGTTYTDPFSTNGQTPINGADAIGILPGRSVMVSVIFGFPHGL